MLSQDITGLLLELLQLVTFYHTGLYYDCRVAFRCDHTADSRLHIARVCGRGSLVKLRELTQIRIKPLRSTPLCWPDTMRASGVGAALRCWPPKKLSPCRWRRRRLEQGGCWMGKVQIIQCMCWCVRRWGCPLSPTVCISGPFRWPSLR